MWHEKIKRHHLRYISIMEIRGFRISDKRDRRCGRRNPTLSQQRRFQNYYYMHIHIIRFLFLFILENIIEFSTKNIGIC